MNGSLDPGPNPARPQQTRQTQTMLVPAVGSARRGRRWSRWLLLILLGGSILMNIGMWSAYREYFSASSGPRERYHSGEEIAAEKIARIEVTGTIMPPFTERILKAINKAKHDETVKGVVLVIDSPGGLVADSHQIYHRLQQLARAKPIVVAMKRMAASGGYYVAMGAGPASLIFAEPTTWTGSIGVIIPRFDVSELARKYGVKSEPLKTGAFKDSLSPFRELGEQERQVWSEILDDAFGRFVTVIAENRKSLEDEAVRELATGQVYTANQAKANGMIDEIGYEDEAVESLKQQLGLKRVRIVSYEFQLTLVDLLTGNMQARQPENEWQRWLEATVPRAMYYCSWAPVVPGR